LVRPTATALLLLSASSSWCQSPAQAAGGSTQPQTDLTSATALAKPAKALREKAAARPRRIIFNNDGNEPVVLCRTPDPNEFLRLRTSGLAGSHVDTIFYCTWSSGFSLFSHDTRVGQIFNTREAMFSNNLAQVMIDQGHDPLRVMVDFCHRHGIELFWSFRVNDTHDSSSRSYGPVMFRANQLKQEHPEFLLGSKTNRPKHGNWTAVNYSRPEIRDLAFRYVQEVCQNYDVDGIELDFFRHPFFFPSTAGGRECTQAEREDMTGLLRRIRQMADERGAKRGRPILVAVRVPDSVEYCRAIGLDIEHWLAGDLVDLLVGGGYFQLNPWEYSVHLGHRYGVKTYASLDETRVKEKEGARLRSSLEAYRGRALNVWNAGADGVYLFNFFDPSSSLWRELGDPAVLKGLDRDYFVSTRGTGPRVSLPHLPFLRLPLLNPDAPVKIAPGNAIQVELNVGENLQESSQGQLPPRLTLRLRFDKLRLPETLTVRLNGITLKNGSFPLPWAEFAVPPSQVRRGTNTVEVASAQEDALGLVDLMLSVRVAKPSLPPQPK
jgi:hypothetical protein